MAENESDMTRRALVSAMLLGVATGPGLYSFESDRTKELVRELERLKTEVYRGFIFCDEETEGTIRRFIGMERQR